MSFGSLIVDHWGAIAGTGGAAMAVNAAVSAMPAKDVKIQSVGDFFRVAYGFVYDFLHNFVSFRSGKEVQVVQAPYPTEPPQTAATK